MWRANDLRALLFVAVTATILCYLLAVPAVKEKVFRGGGDFIAFYGAGRILKGGAGEDLYNYETQKKIQQEIFRRERPLLFYHPPYEALVFSPLAYLSYPKAWTLWSLTNLLILSFVPILLFPYVQGLRERFGPSLVMMSFFSFFPVLMAIVKGQDSILLLLIYSLAFVSLKRGGEFKSGALLALGLFKFQTIIPFLLAFVLRRKWHFLSGFMSASAALALLSIQITGWKGAINYPRFLWMINQSSAYDIGGPDRYFVRPSAMPNLRGLFHAYMAGRVEENYTNLLVLACSLVLVSLSTKRWMAYGKNEAEGLDLPFALHLTTTLLASYHLHLHDLSLLILPIILASNYLATVQDFRSGRHLGSFLIILLLFLSPVHFIAFLYRKLNLLTLAILTFALMLSAEIASRSGRKSAFGTENLPAVQEP